MPTSATRTLLRLRSADNAEAERLQHVPASSQGGFTLIEVLIALSIMALVAAVAVPGLARRLDVAFSDADLQQALTSARLLPARVATLGIDLSLDASAVTKPLPDGSLPLDIPSGWEVKVEKAVLLSHTGTCDAGSFVLGEPATGRRWRIAVARITCEVSVTALALVDS